MGVVQREDGASFWREAVEGTANAGDPLVGRVGGAGRREVERVRVGGAFGCGGVGVGEWEFARALPSARTDPIGGLASDDAHGPRAEAGGIVESSDAPDDGVERGLHDIIGGVAVRAERAGASGEPDVPCGEECVKRVAFTVLASEHQEFESDLFGGAVHGRRRIGRVARRLGSRNLGVAGWAGVGVG